MYIRERSELWEDLTNDRGCNSGSPLRDAVDWTIHIPWLFASYDKHKDKRLLNHQATRDNVVCHEYSFILTSTALF